MPAWFVTLMAAGALGAVATAIMATLAWRHLRQQGDRPPRATVEETARALTSLPEPPAPRAAAPAPVRALEPAMMMAAVEPEAEPPSETKNRIVQFHLLNRSATGHSYSLLILTEEGRILLGRTEDVQDRAEPGRFLPLNLGPDFTPAGG